MLGEFGNAAPTWDSLEHLEEDFENSFPLLNNPKQLWHVRNRKPESQTWYNVDGLDLPDVWNTACAKFSSKDLYISAMAPTYLTLLQGEISRGDRSYYLHYSTIKKPMREALVQESRHEFGIVAKTILECYLCPNSWEWLNNLLDTYVDHTIEFSTYAINWGTLKGFNTVFWEVRKGY